MGLRYDPSGKAPWRRRLPGFTEEGLEAFHDLLEELTGTTDYDGAYQELVDNIDFESEDIENVRIILKAHFEAERLNAHISTDEEKAAPDWVPDGMRCVIADVRR